MLEVFVDPVKNEACSSSITRFILATEVSPKLAIIVITEEINLASLTREEMANKAPEDLAVLLSANQTPGISDQLAGVFFGTPNPTKLLAVAFRYAQRCYVIQEPHPAGIAVLRLRATLAPNDV